MDGLLKEIEWQKERREALAAGTCIRCKRPALPHCHTNAGRQEYLISALCEECFDELFEE